MFKNTHTRYTIHADANTCIVDSTG